MKRSNFAVRFVEFVPRELEDGTLYVSMPYATATHRCCCGCGMKVVTPLSPTDWKIMFDGETVSLEPSIGNWSYPCRSHYVLRRNRVLWAGPMSAAEINAVRRADQVAKQRYYAAKAPPAPAAGGHGNPASLAADPASRPSLWQRIWKWR